MMKMIVMIIVMNLMAVMNFMNMFYYNLCFFMSFMMLCMYMNKDLIWSLISVWGGYEYYSIFLVMLSFWIVGLMFMSLDFKDNKLKMVIFINLLILMVGVFTVFDLLMFYLLFEISLVPTFFLIIYWGGNPERISAGYYLLMYMLMVSFPLLVFIFKIYMYSLSMKFDLIKIVMSSYDMSIWSFMMIFMAFFIKMPVYMLHVWLPKAHVEAPVYGSMILAGVLLKMGSYGIIRLLEVFIKSGVKYGGIIVSVGIVGSVVMSLVSMVQVDMKSLVAYSSVVHMNLMMCSLMTLFKLGALGGYIMMVAHGLCSSGLFYMVNLYYLRTGSRLLFLNKGLMGVLPSMVVWWFLLCSANFSFPYSLAFISEMYMLMVMVNWDIFLMFFLILVCFFSSAYSLYLFAYIQHGGCMFKSSDIGVNYIKEFMVMGMHFFPLIMFLFNLVMLS